MSPSSLGHDHPYRSSDAGVFHLTVEYGCWNVAGGIEFSALSSQAGSRPLDVVKQLEASHIARG